MTTLLNVKQAFRNLIEEWSIAPTAVVCITTDNALNMKATFKSVPTATWITCFGNNLNTAVGMALIIDKVDAAVRACRNVVQGFNHSLKRRRELAKMQAKNETPSTHPHTRCCDLVGVN